MDASQFKDLDPATRILLGPGPSTASPRVLRAMAQPLVGHLDLLRARAVPAVLTPHAGEYAALRGEPVGADRLGAARALAAAVVLYGLASFGVLSLLVHHARSTVTELRDAGAGALRCAAARFPRVPGFRDRRSPR